jgi:hypothetical protein
MIPEQRLKIWHAGLCLEPFLDYCRYVGVRRSQPKNPDVAVSVIRKLASVPAGVTMSRIRKKFTPFLITVVFLSFCGMVFSPVNAGVGMPAPEISWQSWLNSGPLALAELKGKVVLVEFGPWVVTNAATSSPISRLGIRNTRTRDLS